jgi:hypothetical protein
MWQDTKLTKPGWISHRRVDAPTANSACRYSDRTTVFAIAFAPERIRR